MMDQDQSVYIAGMTIAVIPPQATDSSSSDFFTQHRSKSEYEYQSPNSGASGSPGLSSEGYPSSPDTPLDAFQPDLSHGIHTAGSPFIESLGLWESTSPSSLSPAFGLMNLAAETNNHVASDYSNTFGPDDMSLKIDQAQQTRASLSPLTIPHNLNSPQPNQQLDSDEFFSQYLTPDIDAPSFDASSFDDMSLLSSLSVPEDSHLQRRPSAHGRSNSAPWPGSLSPTVFLTPSEPNSSASLLLPQASTFSTEDYCLADTANLSRRHSDTGVHGRMGFSRGRSEGRSAPSSRGSSRGSSPYPRPNPFESSTVGPALGPTGMSISPSQIYDEMGQHLTVPHHFEGGHHGHQRRHSFTLGARPETMMAGAMFEMDPFFGNGSGEASNPLTPVSTPTTPLTPSRTVAQVASAAGISASERRRTKAAKFACPTCPQTFTTNHNLKNHINAHNGVKKHACEFCGRAFTTASVLARHSKTCKSAPPH